MKKRSAFLPATLLLVIIPLSTLAAGINPAFNPNRLVPDTVFTDTKTLGSASAIQKFLEEKRSVLADTSTDFRLKLREPDDALLKEKLGDPRYNLGKPRTAAELIWDAAQMSGINPQVVLVTLNKEQGLITSAFTVDRLQRALNHAMGMGCPDGGSCDDTLSGFYFQLFGNFDAEDNRHIGAPASLMRSFLTPGGRGPTLNGKTAQVGDTITLTNTLGGFEGVQAEQTVTLENLATAALYRYTPHVFNGNYNFWRFFTTWFSYPNGTILKDAGGTYYILQDGKRRQLPIFVAKTRQLSLKQFVSVSPTELSQYPLGKIYQPKNNTVILLDGKYYVFIKGVKYPAARLVLTQRDLNPRKAVRVAKDDAALFPSGQPLLPGDGTILRAKNSTKVYLVKDGVLKRFGKVSLEQYDARENAHAISEAELTDYPKFGYVAPQDSTLVRTKEEPLGIYIMKNGMKRPLPRALFLNLRYKMKDVKILAQAELQSFPTGTHPMPRNNTYFKVIETGELFVYKNRKIHPVTPKLAKKRRYKFTYKFPSAAVKDWPVGEPVK